MPSVDVVWTGHCRDPQIRYRLLGHLHRLAALSETYLRQDEPSFVLSLVGEKFTPPPRAHIETIDHDVSGRILISSWIGPHPDTLVTRAREAGLTVVEPDGDGPQLIQLDRVRLRGLDFKLFDPEGLYPGADRMSFVFLECPEFHFLDGRLVEIAAGATKGESRGGTDALRAGKVYLTSPSVHLRAYLEDWTDCLFSWIRFFLVGDFSWQRREELQGYSDYRGVFEQLQTERGSAAAEEATFDAVLSTFEHHAEHRIEEVQNLARAETR
ncbi:MAG TPA: hypothetical protein VMW57_03285 [Methyloceanibacter sp.]|nr:hypothetical protein [Methyloceanibacter sp.]